LRKQFYLYWKILFPRGISANVVGGINLKSGKIEKGENEEDKGRNMRWVNLS
jgi:hypothetical protein